MLDTMRGVDIFIRAFRTGEPSAATRAEPYIAEDIVFSIGGKVYSGSVEVLARLSGTWPMQNLYRPAYWSNPQPEDSTLRVDAAFPPFGLTSPPFSLRFAFNDRGQIQRVDQEMKPDAPPKPTSVLPVAVRSVIANALANDTPVTVAYVDDEGRPHLSSRGSVVVFSDTQLGLWVRDSKAGLGAAIQKNPNIAVYYWDNKQRVLLSFEGRGYIETGEAARTRLYELIPETEQHHDGARSGKALIVDVRSAWGGTPAGRFRFVRDEE